MSSQLNRRESIKASLAAGLGLNGVIGRSKPGAAAEPALNSGRAQAMIMIYLPGGVAQQDTWDPKQYTPFEQGMRGDQVLATCPSIATSADGMRVGAGLENVASVMHHAALIRSLNNEARFGASHVKAQFYTLTGYLEPVGLKPPSIGSIVARSLGPRAPNVPSYIYIGREIESANNLDKQKALEFTGPGFYGSRYAPFRVPDPRQGLATLNRLAGMSQRRLDRRLELLRRTTALAGVNADDAAAKYMKTIYDARAMMDSPIKKAFDFLKDEPAETLAAYRPKIQRDELLDKNYFYGNHFGYGLLLARRLIESGSRFVQVEMSYDAFRGFDMHDFGGQRMVEMKRQIDGPIAQLIRDLEQRGLLDETLVCIESEFGRTIQSAPAKNATGLAGSEPIGATETHDGSDVVIENQKMYGLHGHFSTNHTAVLFGAGIRGGTVFGKTADRHPMLPTENPVSLIDVHATVFAALGIPADHHYVTEGRPFYVTKDGMGQSIKQVLA